MPYCQLYYHLVWATKNREPLLTSNVEPTIHGYIWQKANSLGGIVFALNGVEDHVHLVVSIPAKISVSTFVGQVKGVASTKFNKSGHDGSPFFWHDEYGAFTFDAKRLPNYIAYVEKQKEHHRDNTVIPILERIASRTGVNVREMPAIYTVEDVAWREEMLGLGD